MVRLAESQYHRGQGESLLYSLDALGMFSGRGDLSSGLASFRLRGLMFVIIMEQWPYTKRTDLALDGECP